jgi:2-C-methyl-D-erythritol 2,4-cyclodiphosphate synthase
MRSNIAETLGVDIDRISIKATTEEGLGFTGKKEGIASAAIAVINSENN